MKFSLQHVVYFFSLILQNILCESVYFFHIMKFSSQHMWTVLFIFFYYSSKHSTQITMLKFNYNNSSDNEKSQKFIRFDKNILNRCCDFLSYINKNKNMLQVRQKTIIQKEMKISQNSQKFQVDCIIKFMSENVWICINSRKDWNYENSSINLSFSNQKSLFCL